MYQANSNLSLDNNNEGNYILSITEELGNIYLNVKWISLQKTDIGLLYRDVTSNKGFETRILDKDTNKVRFDYNTFDYKFITILGIICIDLGIGDLTVDDQIIKAVTLTREELQSITSNYRINIVKDNEGIKTFRIMEINERVLTPMLKYEE